MNLRDKADKIHLITHLAQAVLADVDSQGKEIIDEMLNDMSPSRFRFGEWTISYDAPDWKFVHDNYDGPGDKRCGNATSLVDAFERVLELDISFAYGV